MLRLFSHRRELAAVWRSPLHLLLTLLLAAALALCAAPVAGAATATGAKKATAGKTHSASRYPAGATRASKRVTELAHATRRAREASSSGGAQAPGSSTSTSTSTSSKSKAKKPKKPVLHGNPARALVAFEAMQQYTTYRGSDLYAGEPFSYLWPFSQALAATVSMANIPNLGVSLGKELHARLSA